MKLLVLHAAVTWALAGIIWTIQLVHYPLWSEIGAENFRYYHQRHMRRVILLVVPLACLEILTGLLLLFLRLRNGWFYVSLFPLVWNALSTAFVQGPLHFRLSRGFDPELHRRVVISNWLRVAGWTMRAICMAFVLLRP